MRVAQARSITQTAAGKASSRDPPCTQGGCDQQARWDIGQHPHTHVGVEGAKGVHEPRHVLGCGAEAEVAHHLLDLGWVQHSVIVRVVPAPTTSTSTFIRHLSSIITIITIIITIIIIIIIIIIITLKQVCARACVWHKRDR
eukprot:COSAG05_NODE_2612_length_2837_cov_2.529584_5_plen_142_part_00